MTTNPVSQLPWGKLVDTVNASTAAMILGVRPGRPAEEQRSGVLVARVAVVMLLFAVAGLATIAKDSQYFPKQDPARHVSQETKMKVTSASFVFDRAPHQATRIVPPRPVVRARRAQDSTDALTERIAVTVSMQHRSPPGTRA